MAPARFLRNFLFRAFPANWPRGRRTYVSSVVIFSRTLAPLLLSGAVIPSLSTPLLAQPASCNYSHWVGVKKWTGTVTLSGSGSGQVSRGNYNLTQTITGSVVLDSGTYPIWTGKPNISVTVNLEASGGGNNFLSEGNETGAIETRLEVNPDQCNYTLAVSDFRIPVTVTATSPRGSTTTSSVFGWGPLYTKDGTPIGGGFPIVKIPLPALGTVLSGNLQYSDSQSPMPASWNVSWKLCATCAVKDVQPIGQGNKDWATDDYAYRVVDVEGGVGEQPTIKSLGCALSSLAMALTAAGQPTTPGELNLIGRADPGDFNWANINWDPLVRDASNEKLKWDGLGGQASSDTDGKGVLDQTLCGMDARPVIVAVKGGHHFVLVTGTDNCTYTINDPATGKTDSLDAYNNRFVTRGVVRDPPGDISGFDLAVDDNATLLVTDPNSRRTGVDTNLSPPISVLGPPVQDIPQSAYYEDGISNDLTGAPPNHIAHLVEIFQPAQGDYSIVVKGLQSGPYSLSIRAFSQDGSSQPRIFFSGKAQRGSIDTFKVHFVSTPGTTSTGLSLPGDRNGDGKVDCMDLAIVKASLGKSVGQPGFDPRADVNAKGVVTSADLDIVTGQLPAGTTCP